MPLRPKPQRDLILSVVFLLLFLAAGTAALFVRNQQRSQPASNSADLNLHNLVDHQGDVQQAELLCINIQINSMDAEVQAIAKQCLQGKPGAIVVIDPGSAHVLAMASSPSASKKYSALYESGSMFKLVTAICGLEAGLVTTNTIVNCPGGARIDGMCLNCWKRSGHGNLDLRTALVQKCESYFVEIGLKCGHHRLLRTARALGFHNTQTAATIPEEKLKLQVALLANGRHGTVVSPLQMARLATALANPGLITAEGNGLFSAKTAHVIRSAMLDAVESDWGASKRARISDAQVAAFGGSGTDGKSLDSWTIAFAPYNKPRFAVVLLIEDALSAGRTAAPIAKDLLQKLLAFVRYSG